MNKKQKKVLFRILAASVMMLIFVFLPVEGFLKFALFLIPYLTIGYDILLEAAEGVKNRQPFDENFLMAVATVGAIALGEYVEGAAVMLFYQIGELFQSYAVGKSRRNISQLMDIRPDYANLECGEEIIRADPDEVEPGSVILVRPGEKIPIDGLVIEGESSLNSSALTGESVPRDIRVGDTAQSGCINLNGVLRIRTTKEFGESTVSKILDLVENASSRKSRSEDFIAKFARIYTPAVCYSALALALLPPLLLLISGNAPAWGVWFYRALTFLVISCPCALVVSIPLSFFAGIGGASNAGVLVKGSNYMETLSKVKYVVFDKTGTMTKGVFEVTETRSAGDFDADKLLFYAAHAECWSTHPIAGSIRAAYKGSINTELVSNVTEHSGMGITATVDGHEVAVGNLKLMQTVFPDFEDCGSVGTNVYLALDGKYVGLIVISDVIKPGAKAASEALKRGGVKKLVMLTGDSKNVADKVAAELGIDEVYAELLPSDKVERLEALLEEKRERDTLAFVGDGINDAPVLMRADIGIAMGALGSDAAIEAADIVLMDDDPRKIAKAIAISRKCIRIVYENIFFAIGVKLLCLLLGALGLANMWAAIFADVGVMVIAVLNAIRALNVKAL